MYKVAYFILIILCYTDSLNPEICQAKPQEKHCLIEWMARDRWPHTIRYVYDWVTRNCFEIRWSQHCPKVATPTVSNNFPSHQECMNECAGWN
ncbi:uncharacterized protein LOC131851856 [Achroia grisella]|uniref:uncharacterized protein LOC131851856 n=1 Tax=Achroia grisella TaxID=688607 RepID=UPI0027D246EC|nr:uncharacterized protein LOC131851856 [Achroia grisella]